MSQDRILIKGNEAVAHAAISAGCKCYFGYPITPQSDIPEILSSLIPKAGGVFVQAESEIGAINMVLGAGAAGVRAMTSTSSPGLSLMQEALSYMAGSEIPGVIVNMSRGGPGLGSIDGSQGDYFQVTRGAGHGGVRVFVLAPATCQECYDMTIEAFSLAFKYRTPVIVLGDAMVAQLKEPVVCWTPEVREDFGAESWCLTGCEGGREHRVVKSLELAHGALGEHNARLREKACSMSADVQAELYLVEDAEVVVVAFGSVGRIVKSAVDILRKDGHKVGLVRPKTLFPYPSDILEALAVQGKRFFVVEQNNGQMLDDVRLAIRKYADAEVFLVPIGVYLGAEDLAEPLCTFLRSK